MGRRLALVAVVVVVLTGGGVWWFFLRDDAPPPAALQDCEGDPGPTLDVDGRWEVVHGNDAYVGYRIDEKFGGDTLSRTVVGRTGEVSGGLEIDGGRVTEATFRADLRGLTSDEPRRDAYLGDHALETDDVPEATFTLDEPVDLPALAPGEGVAFDGVGTFALHGIEREVTIPLEACAVDVVSVEVVGHLPIELADYEIDTPDIPGLVRVEDHGTMELRLRLSEDVPLD